MPKRRQQEGSRFVMISVVAQTYQVHPQTLRLYERQGLIRPARSAGNTRLYDETAIRRLEAILTLTRDLGVNLAGVDVILNLREQVAELEAELQRLGDELRQRDRDRRQGVERTSALVPVTVRSLIRRDD